MSRIDKITRAMAEIERCVKACTEVRIEDRLSCFLGECDWREELHRLIWEENDDTPDTV